MLSRLETDIEDIVYLSAPQGNKSQVVSSFKGTTEGIRWNIDNEKALV